MFYWIILLNVVCSVFLLTIQYKSLYTLYLLGYRWSYIRYTYYTLITKDNIFSPPYHNPTELIFLDILLTVISKIKLIIALNNPTAVENSYCALSKPIL